MRTTRRVIILAAGAISLSVAAAAGAAAVTRAGAVAPAAQGVTAGVRPPGAGDASATAAARPAGSWGRAIAVPGLGALNKGGNAPVSEVSCASAGNCAAGGSYRDRHHHYQGFVASERHGRWAKAIEVPGLGALNVGGDAEVTSVSCGSAGNCAVGGFLSLGVPGHEEITGLFVVNERRGRWGKAVPLGPQTGEEVGDFNSVSCTSAGNCLAGGDAADCYCTNSHAFVVQERAGRWRSFRAVPGLWALGHIDSWINSVACPSAGNCAVGGGYQDDNGNQNGFVAGEGNGVWGRAIEVPGLATLNTGANADVSSVSCGSAGNCAAGGYYTDGDGHFHGYVAAEQDGVWGKAIQVPGLAALNKGENAGVGSVSCGSAGSCVAGGAYADRSHRLHGFVAVERNGRWGTAIQVPGLAAPSKRGDAFVTSVSCASAGNCAAGGYYTDRSGHHQGFVVVQRNGRWGTAIPVPGLSALKAGGSAEVGSLSCPSPGHCTAGGSFRGRSGPRHGFVTQAG